MDLRRRISQALAGAGAILIVGGLSFGGGVALAEPGPAGPSAERDKATTSSSEPKSSSKPRKSKGDSDKSKSDGDRTDKTGGTDTTRGDRSTGTTATSTTATTAPTATTRPTPTTRPTATTRPTPTTRPTATTGTTAPPSTSRGAPAGDSTQTAPQQVEPGTGQSTDTTTAPSNRTGRAPGTSPSPNRPAARSGSGLPPGMYPVGPGPNSTGATPTPTIAPAPNAVAPPSNPVTVAETQPAEGTTDTTADAGVSDPVVTKWPPDTDVRGTEQERGDSPAPARRSAQLGETGDGTHRLILLGGVAMLLGAVVVAFTGRDRPRPDSADSVPAGPAYRPRPRRELDGWEEGVPLAPAKRELARHRLGISAGYGLPGDGPAA